MIGRYLDALAAKARWAAVDRVIEAQAWRRGAFAFDDGARCLLGHTMDVCRSDGMWDFRDWDAEPNEVSEGRIRGSVGDRFDRLTARFGLQRVVRAIKQRAGKHTRPNMEAPHTIDSAVNELAEASA